MERGASLCGSMDKDKDNTDNQRHKVWNSFAKIQKVLYIKRKCEEWELACNQWDRCKEKFILLHSLEVIKAYGMVIMWILGMGCGKRKHKNQSQYVFLKKHSNTLKRGLKCWASPKECSKAPFGHLNGGC